MTIRRDGVSDRRPLRPTGKLAAVAALLTVFTSLLLPATWAPSASAAAANLLRDSARADVGHR